MKRATSGISLTLAISAGLIGAMLSPALADGDPYYSNGINPSGVRTPVPAPIPYPVEEADWYFRGDFAAGFGSSPSVNVLGTNLVESVFGPVGQSESFEPSFTGGVGVGYVWGPHIRTDLTVDVHSIMNTEQIGSGTFRCPTFARPTRRSSCRPSCSPMPTTIFAPARRGRRTSAAVSASPSIRSRATSTYTANDVTNRIGRQSDHRRAVCSRGHGRCVL